ncbi:auxin-responsive protein SAUR78-like [Trifolium pratense]|uniref:Uncharacterized protein n=1 Tax=Trifolium pratense TaxID=57577 RepID=A0ACB0JHY5_TRIPR|nr:auxin-responsive protein SAUR78-like [Trifolium pratense]CAJ2644706.1 unnamed protein product [Trifolium pratense]
MEKVAKLTKLKSVLKKWNTFTYYNNNKHNRSSIRAVANDDVDSCALSGQDLRPVFVGKTRRRYLVNSEVVEHPLFRELVDRSRDSTDVNIDDDEVNVACEVVLFEHMLWMLENSDPQPESLDELVDYYSC